VSRMLEEAPVPEDALAALSAIPQIPASNGDGYLHELQQAIAQESQQGVLAPEARMADVAKQVAAPIGQEAQGHGGLVTMGSDDLGDAIMTVKGSDSKLRPSLLDMSESERIRRRREINRNSQRRIRERRMKELDELRTETTRMHHDNEQLIRQVDCITAEKAELLRQIQDLTEKWQQSIAENAVLNRENLQLRSNLQQLTGLPGVVPGSISGGVPAPQAQKVVGNQ